MSTPHGHSTPQSCTSNSVCTYTWSEAWSLPLGRDLHLARTSRHQLQLPRTTGWVSGIFFRIIYEEWLAALLWVLFTRKLGRSHFGDTVDPSREYVLCNLTYVCQFTSCLSFCVWKFFLLAPGQLAAWPVACASNSVCF